MQAEANDAQPGIIDEREAEEAVRQWMQQPALDLSPLPDSLQAHLLALADHAPAGHALWQRLFANAPDACLLALVCCALSK